MRAKVKQLEDFPDYLKCCPQTVEKIRSLQGMTLTLYGNYFMFTDRCPYCLSVFANPCYRALEFPGCTFAVDSIDIDESGE